MNVRYTACFEPPRVPFLEIQVCGGWKIDRARWSQHDVHGVEYVPRQCPHSAF
jgi:hypothetical protein